MNKEESKVKSQKSKIKYFFYCFLAFFGLLFLILNLRPSAVMAATYDPYNVIPNDVFINKDSMTAAQIESFLVSHGSFYRNYTIPEYISTPFPYNNSGNNTWSTVNVRQIYDPTGDRYWGKKVSQLIYDECQAHGINPQLVLVMLQKESSIVTQGNPDSVTKAWPLFFGFNETMASYGYNYSQSRQVAIDYGGVGQQIAYTVNWLRVRYNSSLSRPPTDDVPVNWAAVNQASRVLYIYTPHSQINVFNLMQIWFAGGFAYYPFGPVPNSQLGKVGTTYYLIYNGKYYNLGTTSLAVQNYGHSTTTVHKTSLTGNSNGGNLSNYIRSLTGQEYLVAGGLKYAVYNSSVFKGMWGLTTRTPTSVSAELINAIPSAPRTLSCIVKPYSSYSYYYIDSGARRYGMWSSDAFWAMWGFTKQDVVVMPDNFVKSLPYLKMLTALVKSPTSSQVYYVDRGMRKYPMWMTAVFWEMWGFRYADITTISSGQISAMPTQRPFTALIRSEAGGDLYYVDNGGKKYHIPPGPYLWNMWAFRLPEVTVVSRAQFAALPTAGTLGTYVSGHLTPWLTCRMYNGRCFMTERGSNPVSTLTQGQFDALRRR
ncbi:MAG: hypothetical protein PHW50_02580 [Patescibacteria group bacterium]|nr:hypothetical protein [Patescibacteria group bacterium]